MAKYLSKSEADTKKIAAEIAKKSSSNIFALIGELGVGKTTFVQGFAQGLKLEEKIISPTFVLIRSHQIPNSSKTLYHIDLYRLKNQEDLKNLGLDDILHNLNHVVLIEWAEKIKPFLPKDTTWITIEKDKGNKRNSRQISVKSPHSLLQSPKAQPFLSQ